MSRLHDKSSFGRANVKDNHELGLDDLIVGAPIAKGCSAVVYAAAFKDNRTESPLKVPEYDSDESSIASVDNKDLSPIRDVNRYVHNFGSSLENPHFLNRSSNTENQDRNRREAKPVRKVLFNSKANVNYQSSSNWSQSDANSARNSNESFSTVNFEDDNNSDIKTHPLALKMMFNYDIQSNAMSILRAMYKETIPAVNKYSNADADGWEKQLMEQTVQLPPHPNIVLMVGVFCAQVPNLMQSSSLYPMALPQRLNPQGYGRNMSLFLLMKRYEYSLCEYMKSQQITMRTRFLLFAQLLEGVAHLYRHGVAHRDLKSDNILIDMNGNDVHPILVLSDFGCCLADKTNGLTLPYTSMDMDKGGNTALMPPEIITKTPGTFSILDYSKSDLWACGAIAYEIFGSINPFYGQSKMNESEDTPLQPILKSATYRDEDLPPLSENVPSLVQKLVANILQRNPNHRLAPDTAANVMQLFLWAPSSWLKPSVTVPTPEILQWLLSLTTKVLYESRLGGIGSPKRDPTDKFGLRQIETNRTHTEYSLLSSFLIRSQLQQIRSALDWIHQSIEIN